MVTFHRNDLVVQLGLGLTSVIRTNILPPTGDVTLSHPPLAASQAPSAGRGVRNAEEVKKSRVSRPEIKAVALELGVSTKRLYHICLGVFFPVGKMKMTIWIIVTMWFIDICRWWMILGCGVFNQNRWRNPGRWCLACHWSRSSIDVQCKLHVIHEDLWVIF